MWLISPDRFSVLWPFSWIFLLELRSGLLRQGVPVREDEQRCALVSHCIPRSGENILGEQPSIHSNLQPVLFLVLAMEERLCRCGGSLCPDPTPQTPARLCLLLPVMVPSLDVVYHVLLECKGTQLSFIRVRPCGFGSHQKCRLCTWPMITLTSPCMVDPRRLGCGHASPSSGSAWRSPSSFQCRSTGATCRMRSRAWYAVRIAWWL